MSSIVLDRIQVAQAQFPASLIHILSVFPGGGGQVKDEKERSFQTSIRVRRYFLLRYKFPERLLDSTVSIYTKESRNFRTVSKNGLRILESRSYLLLKRNQDFWENRDTKLLDREAIVLKYFIFKKILFRFDMIIIMRK